MTEGQLGRYVHLDSGTLAPLLKRLEKAGYILRIRPENDELTLVLSLTEEGKDLEEKAKSVPSAMRDCIPLSLEELQTLRSMLSRTLTALDQNRTNEPY